MTNPFLWLIVLAFVLLMTGLILNMGLIIVRIVRDDIRRRDYLGVALVLLFLLVLVGVAGYVVTEGWKYLT